MHLFEPKQHEQPGGPLVYDILRLLLLAGE
jgi:hypothetical protein